MRKTRPDTNCRRAQAQRHSWAAAAAAVSAVLMVAAGCGQTGGRAVTVVGDGREQPAAGLVPSPAPTVVEAEPDAVSVPGRPPDAGVGPGEGGVPEPEEGVGQEGSTGGAVDGDGAANLLGPGGAGGLLWNLPDSGKYASVTGEVLDWCDDADAFFALRGRALAPGEEITPEDRSEMDGDRSINKVVCDGTDTPYRCRKVDPYAFLEEIEQEKGEVDQLIWEWLTDPEVLGPVFHCRDPSGTVPGGWIFQMCWECGEPRGNRFAYFYEDRYGRAEPTSGQAAAEGRVEEARRAEVQRTWPEGHLLGFAQSSFQWRFTRRDFPLVNRDEVVVLPGTVTVKEGTVRGLVHNLSRTLYAREVVVTARPAGTAISGRSGGQPPASWRWPLTVQPGERAPFEIAGLPPDAASDTVAIEVAASLSAQPDLTRSLSLKLEQYYEFDEAYFRNSFPHVNVGNRPIPSGFFSIFRVAAAIVTPESPPGLASQVEAMTIEDPRIFIAHLDISGDTKDQVRVEEVAELTPYTENSATNKFTAADYLSLKPRPGTSSTHGPAWMHTAFIPQLELPDVIYADDTHWLAWAGGGANPPPAPQQQPGDNPDG